MSARLSAHGVAIRRGGHEIIHDATFELSAGLWWLEGDNGAGKSTLLRCLAGVAPVARGRIEIAGHDLERQPTEARAQLGYAPQSADLFPYLGVGELLTTVAGLRGVDPGPSAARAREWIGPRCLEQRIDTLSAGQRRKLILCAALCGKPRVLLLDEPEAGLDQGAARELRATLTALASDRVILVASHGIETPDDGAKGRLTVRQGRVRASERAARA